ncbi:hypothetical protein CMUS01_08517 [Colletotrichum musicola]|uniref:Uncharacterized protein n=1 Tax=Colletotrichum musicola TaxID=2175873 RepID=A0A8H6KD86_9PEZI|nr:hypothetical protein CMUS01_08517 [Colletotrichum musicola]
MLRLSRFQLHRSVAVGASTASVVPTLLRLRGRESKSSVIIELREWRGTVGLMLGIHKDAPGACLSLFAAVAGSERWNGVGEDGERTIREVQDTNQAYYDSAASRVAGGRLVVAVSKSATVHSVAPAFHAKDAGAGVRAGF